MNKKSEIFERILEFSIFKGFKSINSFSDYLGFGSAEKLYRLGRKAGSKPSYEILKSMADKFQDLDLNWLIRGTGEMILPEYRPEREGTAEPPADLVTDAVTRLLQSISAVNDAILEKHTALLKQELSAIAKNEKEVKEKVNQIYNILLKAKLSEDIEKTINKLRE